MRNHIKVLLSLVLFSICLMAQAAYAAAPEQTGTIEYKGVPFHVSIGEIGKNDDGNTTVQVLMDFEVLVEGFNPGTAIDAVTEAIRVKIVHQNETFDAATISIEGEGFNMEMAKNGMMLAKFSHIVYQFDTAVVPEEIIVAASQGSSLTFNGEIKNIIE